MYMFFLNSLDGNVNDNSVIYQSSADDTSLWIEVLNLFDLLLDLDVNITRRTSSPYIHADNS